MKRFVLSVATIVAIGVLGGSVSALADESPSASTTTTVDRGIMWVESTVGASEGRVKIEILAPAKDGRRKVWQRCTFISSGTGSYRCGIDVSDGSLAAKREGRWLAKVTVAGALADRHPFRL